ncbi:MAG: response regulator of RpoS [Methanoregulaceae archaeon PtaB.Bin056]|jgi:PAS domain S-box-containing protein|nr:MAG: response regulator of RpoS [Methanoregulaceae archaeon PtaB.Bin056]
MISVLLVDDEVQFLEVTRMFLEKGRGIRVTTATSGEQALELLGHHRFDAIISDYAMPGMNGIEFMKRVKAMGDDTPFIIFTGKGREDVVIDALNFGADLYLEKSPDPRTQFSEMMQKVKNIVAIRADIQVAREKMRIFSSVMERFPGMVFRIRLEGREAVLFASAGAELLTGYPADDLVRGDPVFGMLIVQEDRDRVDKVRRTALRSGDGYHVQYRLITRSGDEKRVMEGGFAVPGNDGGVLEGYILDLDSICHGSTLPGHQESSSLR